MAVVLEYVAMLVGVDTLLPPVIKVHEVGVYIVDQGALWPYAQEIAKATGKWHDHTPVLMGRIEFS